MGFTSYKGSIGLTAGLTPASDNLMLIESCNIQIDDDGNSLKDYIDGRADQGHTFEYDENTGVLTINPPNSAVQKE